MMYKNGVIQCALCEVMKCWHPEIKGIFPTNCARKRYTDLVEETIEKGFTNPEARR